MKEMTISPNRRIVFRCTMTMLVAAVINGGAALVTCATVVWFVSSYKSGLEEGIRSAHSEASAAQIQANKAIDGSDRAGAKLTEIQGDLRELKGKFDQFVMNQKKEK